ncbi:MAG TPA: AAA family ATPase, partial [Actinomycetota bacterium]|nr:AAA family ATPase [Actinomycetota bacterium]
MLVGREAEVSALDALLAGAAGGVGGLVAILGPAGIGKSRLAREAQARAPRWGIDSLVGRAVQTSKLLSL